MDRLTAIEPTLRSSLNNPWPLSPIMQCRIIGRVRKLKCLVCLMLIKFRHGPFHSTDFNWLPLTHKPQTAPGRSLMYRALKRLEPRLSPLEVRYSTSWTEGWKNWKTFDLFCYKFICLFMLYFYDILAYSKLWNVDCNLLFYLVIYKIMETYTITRILRMEMTLQYIGITLKYPSLTSHRRQKHKHFTGCINRFH